MNDILNLISAEGTREVFCGVRSVGMREFYQSSATDYHPEIKFVLADYLDYNGETLARYDGLVYRILRTYRTGQELELVAERAAAEDGAAYE